METQIVSSANINKAFRSSLHYLFAHGRNVHVRDRDRIELVGYGFDLADPRRRILTCPFRYNNIFATIGEILWVFASRDDLYWLGTFLPNAYDYSDDGRRWRGAYGPRLRMFEGKKMANVLYGTGQRLYVDTTIDQIRNVVNILEEDMFSTQAVMNIYSADRDQYLLPPSKDVPCTMHLQFFIRDDKLDLLCSMRSNDAIWGCFNINIVEWTFLQEVMANILGVKVGKYMHRAGSFHYYEELTERVNAILSVPGFDVYNYIEPMPIDNLINLDEFYWNVELAASLVEQSIQMREVGEGLIQSNVGSFTSNYVRGMYEMCIAYLSMLSGGYDYAFETLLDSHFIPEDLRVAGLEYYIRFLKKEDQDQKVSNAYVRANDNIAAKYVEYKDIIKFITGEWWGTILV